MAKIRKTWEAQEKINASDLNGAFSQIARSTSYPFAVTDGVVNMDGSNTFASFASKSGNTYTLTRNVYASTLTIGAAVTLQTDGYIIYAQTTAGSGIIKGVTGNNGTAGVAASGSNGAGGAGATASGTGPLKTTPGSAGSGGTSHGSIIANATNDYCSFPSDAVLVGTVFIGASGADGGMGHFSSGCNLTTNGIGVKRGSRLCTEVTVNSIGHITKGLAWNPLTNKYEFLTSAGVAGAGSGGTGNSTNRAGGGGGSGASGGPIILVCGTFAGSFTFESIGGNGGDGGGGSGGQRGGGGGAGGSGGAVVVAYQTKTWSGSYTLTGGTGGAAGASATAGSNGNTGMSFEYQYTDNLTSFTADTIAPGDDLNNNFASIGAKQFGTGADGDATINNTTVLTRDMHYQDLVINGVLNTNGFRVFVRGTVSGEGTLIGAEGIDGEDGADADFIAVQPQGGDGTDNGEGAFASWGGGDGGNGNFLIRSGTDWSGGGENGETITYSYFIANGGDGGGNAIGNSGGTTSASTLTTANIGRLAYEVNQGLARLSGVLCQIRCGPGGGGGGGAIEEDSTNVDKVGGGGGAGGGGGGIVYLSAYNWAGSFTIRCRGGHGGDGGDGVRSVANPGDSAAGGGGGGGGAGGFGLIIYGSKSWTGTYDFAGGDGGIAGASTGTGASVDGIDGEDGTYIEIPFSELIY